MGVMMTEYWYQDNTLAEPLDFHGRYKPSKLPKWADARSRFSTFMMPATKFMDMDKFPDDWLAERFLPAHKDHAISLLSVGCLNGPQYGKQRVEIDAITRLKDFGKAPSTLLFESALSKDTTSFEDDVANLMAYAALLKEAHPDLHLGMIDAEPCQGEPWQDHWPELFSRMAANGTPITTALIDDVNHIYAPTANAVRKMCHGLGVTCGLILTHRGGGQTSAPAFQSRLLDVIDMFIAGGGAMDYYLTTAWFKYPRYSLDNAAEAPGLLTTHVACQQRLARQ